MKMFYVGQRVRTVNPGPIPGFQSNDPTCYGRIAIVLSIPGCALGFMPGNYDYAILVDGESKNWDCIKEALEPLDEKDSYERFMERVMNPLIISMSV